MVAFNEIFLMPLIVFLLASGRASLVTPSTTGFGFEVQLKKESLLQDDVPRVEVGRDPAGLQPPSAQAFLRTIVHKMVQLVKNMAPATVA